MGHPTQSTAPPQPSPMTPQYGVAPFLHVSGTQPGSTHTRLRQLSPVGHAPQSSPRPQPSPMMPQSSVPPMLHTVFGGQLGPPTQTCDSHDQSPMQTPQSTEPPQRSPICPQ
jgi:hypothetical protein